MTGTPPISSTLQPVTLEGERVRLEPLSMNHLDALCEIGLDPALWEFTTTQVRSEMEMRKYIHAALEGHVQGTALPFTIIDKASGSVVGTTRYANIEPAHRRLEIGWTWVGRPWQRTYVNTDVKYLLLTHAFESLGCIRVEFKTDSLNKQSRKALLRIGAKEEGTLRNHMMVHDGRLRHSVYFSIIDSEWPGAKRKLETLMSKGKTTSAPPD